MIIREIITRITNTETGEITEKSNIIDGKLYGLFSIVSNKTVREKEKRLTTWWNHKKGYPSEKMQRTNRGWFIDNYNVDEKAVEDWFNATGNDRNGSKPKKKWNYAKKVKK